MILLWAIAVMALIVVLFGLSFWVALSWLSREQRRDREGDWRGRPKP